MAKKMSLKEQIVFSILTKLFVNRKHFYNMHAKDQLWLLENTLEGICLIVNAIELRDALGKEMQHFSSPVPGYIKNSKHVSSMIAVIDSHQDILLELDENDLLWMKNVRTERLISFIRQIISNREKIANWINSYYHNIDLDVNAGNFYINNIGVYEEVNLIGSKIFPHSPGKIWVFYVIEKGEHPGAWNCISSQYSKLGNESPQYDPALSLQGIKGRKLTPRIEQKLAKEGIVINKTFLESFRDKIADLKVVDRFYF